MKELVSLMLLLFVYQASAQNNEVEYDKHTGIPSRTMIVLTEKPKGETFNLVRGWVAGRYTNNKDIVQAEDPESGQLVFTVTEPIENERFKSLKFTTTVDIRDGKYRCVSENVKVFDKHTGSYDVYYGGLVIKKYATEIAKLDSAILGTKKKEVIDMLSSDRNYAYSRLGEYQSANNAISLYFNVIQYGIKEKVAPFGAERKGDF